MNDMRRNDYLRRRQDRRMQRDHRNPYGSRGGYVDSRSGYGRRGDRMDGFNPHGSRGAYYGRQGQGQDYGMDYRDYASEHNRGGSGPNDFRPYGPRGGQHSQQYGEHSRPNQFEIYGVGGMRPYNDYNNDYRRDYNSGMDYYDGNYDYRSDYDYRNDYYGSDYAGHNMEEEYKKKLYEWIEKLSSKNRFRQHGKEHIMQQAKNMGIKFEEYDEDEFYAIYLMHVSDYPTISNEYNMYIRMAKDWLEDKDIAVSPSEKVCKYLYEIVLAED